MAYCTKCGAPIYHTTKVEGPYFTSDWSNSQLCRQCEISDQLDNAFLVIELDLTTIYVFDSCIHKIFNPCDEKEYKSLHLLQEMGLVSTDNILYGWFATELGRSAIVSEGKLYIGVLQ